MIFYILFALDVILEVNLMDHRPSVIAWAAALVALDRKLTKQTLELEINSLSPNVFPEIVSPHYKLNFSNSYVA